MSKKSWWIIIFTYHFWLRFEWWVTYLLESYINFRSPLWQCYIDINCISLMDRVGKCRHLMLGYISGNNLMCDCVKSTDVIEILTCRE